MTPSGRCLSRLVGWLAAFSLGAACGVWFEWKTGLLEGLTPAAVGPAQGSPSALSLEELEELEERVRRDPTDIALASEYRKQCVRHEAHDRSIELFAGLAKARPELHAVRLQLACAYVDKIPACSGLAAFVAQGTLAQKSLDQLDAVLAAEPDSWAALYSRGMNHLHWPRALEHSVAAAQDFQRLVELQEADAGETRPYYLRAYLGLGDAWAKHGDIEAARAAWERGRERFPDSEALRTRLALESAAAARAFVEATCSLESEIETDYSFLAEP